MTCPIPELCEIVGRHIHGRALELYHTRSDYRRTWARIAGIPLRDLEEKIPPQRVGEITRKTKCAHLGPVKRREPRSKCGCRSSDRPVDVHWCQMFGECTKGPNKLQNPVTGDDVASCMGCKSRRPIEKRKVVVRVPWSPGDNVVSMAAIRALTDQYPDEFDVSVRTHYEEIWRDFPGIEEVQSATNDDDRHNGEKWINLDAEPLLSKSNDGPHHYVQALTRHLSRSLGLPVPLEIERMRGWLPVTEEDKKRNQVNEVSGSVGRPWWIINAGGKGDCTCKIWPTEFFQEVVDKLRGEVRFVQIGANAGDSGGHIHPKLDGVVDLRGKTSHIDLRRLVYHCDGVLCGNTYLMHLASAVETAFWTHGYRPCVVLGGGRESPRWYSYPGHQVFHTVGMMECCRHGGCWKWRVQVVGDGRPYDDKPVLCKVTEEVGDQIVPRCMAKIGSEEIVAAIRRTL